MNLIGRAGRSQEDNQAAAASIRSLFGTSSISGKDGTRLSDLQRIVSAGQITSTATSMIERAVLVDNTTAADIAYQVEKILRVPPLTLFVNPNQFTRTYGTVQQYSARTRKGFVFERWGESLLTISFSGSTGAFIAGAGSNEPRGIVVSETTSATGVQFASMRDSAAYQNFNSLLLFYQNNGYIYDTIGKTEAHLMIGAIAIDYDQFTYIGHIDSFDYSFSDQMPNRLEWNMEFIAHRVIDLASAPVLVQPQRSPSPNPSYPSRYAQRFPQRPDGVTGGGIFRVSGTEQFAETPLQLFVPSQLR